MIQYPDSGPLYLSCKYGSTQHRYGLENLPVRFFAAKEKSVLTRNIKNKDPQKGKATGIKIVKPTEIKAILEQLNLPVNKKPLDGISYEN